MFLRILASFFLLVLFFLLGKSADLIVFNLKKFGKEIGIKLYFLGLILGFFTSSPELAVGVNSLLKNISRISLGNLLGGIIVLFGLILGVSVILNRRIKTEGVDVPFFLILPYLFLPLVLGMDGKGGAIDGLILIIFYFFLLYFIYKKEKKFEIPKVGIIDKRKILKYLFLIVSGLILLIFISDAVLKVTQFIFNGLGISLFFIGLIIYSIGTNLPEITIAFRAWRNHSKELSISNLVGSAMANVFVVGILFFLRPMEIKPDVHYCSMAGFFLLILILLGIFYRTGKRLVRIEGIIFLIVYFLFLLSQVYFEWAGF